MWSSRVVKCKDKKDKYKTYWNNNEVEVSNAILQSKVRKEFCQEQPAAALLC